MRPRNFEADLPNEHRLLALAVGQAKLRGGGETEAPQRKGEAGTGQFEGGWPEDNVYGECEADRNKIKQTSRVSRGKAPGDEE